MADGAYIPNAFYRVEPYTFLWREREPRPLPSIVDLGFPFDLLDRGEFVYYGGKTHVEFPLIPRTGFLDSVYLIVSKPTGKVTPKQRRRARKKRNHRERHAHKYDAPFNAIEKV